MMADGMNTHLQKLFDEAELDLDAGEFTAGVMARTHKLRNRIVAGGIGVALLAAVCIWLLALPVQKFSQLITQALAISLVDLGDGWLAWAFAPVNNIASLLVLSVKATRVAWKKIVGMSYGY